MSKSSYLAWLPALLIIFDTKTGDEVTTSKGDHKGYVKL